MIYVHIPFCRSFCTYCDFYSEVAPKCAKAEDAAHQDSLFIKFGKALCDEAVSRAEDISGEVNTLYIGGGTPSVLPLSVYRRLSVTLAEIGYGGPFDEFTIEVNPDDIVEKGEKYVEGLLELGVNRVSMGVQSFDDGILRFMSRRHDAAAARKAYAILEEAGVGNISIDLIFGLPQLSDRQWQRTLEQALDISAKGIPPKHVSSYQLSVEPGSALARMADAGLWSEASESLCRRQYDMLCNTLSSAGYNHYEISNFSLPGYEARHNSAYWKHVPYVGLGPGAHSFIAGVRSWNKADLNVYMSDVSGGREWEELSPEQTILEKIMLGLRTSEGVPEGFLRDNCEGDGLGRMISAGSLVPAAPGYLRIPEDRFFISDSIIAEIV